MAVAVWVAGTQTAHAVTTCGEGRRVLTVSKTENGDRATLQTSSDPRRL